MFRTSPPPHGNRDSRIAAIVRALTVTASCVVLVSCAASDSEQSVSGASMDGQATPESTQQADASGAGGGEDPGSPVVGFADTGLTSAVPTAPPFDDSIVGPTTAPVLPTIEADADQPVDLRDGPVIDLVGIEEITVSAETPGEVSGAAVVVTISMANGSDTDLDLSSAVVELVAEGGELGIATSAGPAAHLGGTLAPGKSTEGSYVFMLEPAERELTVSVNHTAGAPIVIFTAKSS